MTVQDLMTLLEGLCPLSYACDWDNPGLQVGRREREIQGIYVALDATEPGIRKAREAGCNLLLTHHPLLFSPLRQVTGDSVPGRLALELAEAGMACVSMHTNFDAAPGCMADLAAERLGLRDSVYLEPVEDGGIGKVGELPEPETLEAFCRQVKEAFRLPSVTLYDGGPADRKISRVGILPGSGKGEIGLAEKLGAQVYVTGDMGHHPGLDAVADGLAVVDAGHYGIEWIFIDFMAAWLREHLQEPVPVFQAPFGLPSRVV